MLESITDIKQYPNLNPFCVLGVLDTEEGRSIAERMREWLVPNYSLIEIYHDGMLYEWPALRYMQDMCIETGNPCLYVHTRGAVNKYWTTEKTHRLWKEEFGDNRNFYFNLVGLDGARVVCPFADDDKHTWYNGFVANASAMKAIEPLKRNFDRMVFERIFMNSSVNVIATKAYGPIGVAREYLRTHY